MMILLRAFLLLSLVFWERCSSGGSYWRFGLNCVVDVSLNVTEDKSFKPQVECKSECGEFEKGWYLQRAYFHDQTLRSVYNQMVEISLDEDGDVECHFIADASDEEIKKQEKEAHDTCSSHSNTATSRETPFEKSCPAGFTFNEQVDLCQMVGNEVVPWGEAREMCRANGGFLSLINSQQKRNATLNMFSGLLNWKEDLWIDQGGRKASEALSGPESSFPDLPNAVQEDSDEFSFVDQQCIVLKADLNYQLSYEACTTKNKFVCESDPSPWRGDEATKTKREIKFKTEKPFCRRQFRFVRVLRSCYYWSDYTMSWTEASKVCVWKGGSLVVVNGALEQAKLADLTKVNSWIGLNDKKKEGVYEWVDGSPYSFSSWNKQAPDSRWIFSRMADCVELSSQHNFNWNDRPCSLKRRFICESKPVGAERIPELHHGVIPTTPEPPKKRVLQFHKAKALKFNGNPTSVPLCPEGYKYFPNLGRCFVRVIPGHIYQDAKFHCYKINGILVHIKSAEENLIFSKILGTWRAWIALTDFNTPQVFDWLDQSKLSYAKWHSGQPSDPKNTKNCTCLDGRHKTWYNINCNNKHGFFCEYREFTCWEGYTYIKELNSCYKRSKQKTNWIAAAKQCEESGGFLVTIHSQKEQTRIAEFAGTSSWIGLSDIDHESVFRFVDGTTANYVNWIKGQPNNVNEEYGNNANCVMMVSYVDFKWNDRSCVTYDSHYVCESGPVYAECNKGYLYNRELDSCYSYETDRNNFERARIFCMEIGGKLVTIESEFENQLVANLTKEDAWIGVKNNGSSKQTWVDGYETKYSRWETKQYGPNLCTYMKESTGSKWSSSSCDVPRMYVCEHKPRWREMKLGQPIVY